MSACPTCQMGTCDDHGLYEERQPRRETVGVDGVLNPAALTGSWFHKIDGGQIVATGLVVAQVQAEPLEPTFLMEFEEGFGADEKLRKTQRLVKLSQMFPENEMFEYRFFDFEDAMREEYGAALLADLDLRPGARPDWSVQKVGRRWEIACNSEEADKIAEEADTPDTFTTKTAALEWIDGLRERVVD